VGDEEVEEFIPRNITADAGTTEQTIRILKKAETLRSNNDSLEAIPWNSSDPNQMKEIIEVVNATHFLGAKFIHLFD
jgi:hypothetical protein